MIYKSLHNKQFKNGSFRDCGQGVPVVLLHGFAEDGDIWQHQTRFLKHHFRLIIPDLPGSGRSQLHEPLSIESMASFVHAILVQEKIKHCILIGHSMGGYVTLAFAEQYPEMLKGWGLFHSTAQPDSEEKKEARRRSIEMINNYGSYAFLRQTIPNQFSRSFKQLYPDAVDQLIQKGIQFSQQALIAYYEAMIQRPDRQHVIKESTVPVLFIIGKEDTAVPLNNILPQTHLPMTAAIHIAELVGHMGLWEIKDQANEWLYQFITYCCNHSFQ